MAKQPRLRPIPAQLNDFHPNLHFTHVHSTSISNFIDLTFYKITTIYPWAVYKGIIMGECVQYLWTNTDEYNCLILTQTLKSRLIKTHYPPHFIDNCIAKIKHTRHRCLQASQPRSITTKPIFKCLPLPQFRQFQAIILHNYNKIQELIDRPLIH